MNPHQVADYPSSAHDVPGEDKGAFPSCQPRQSSGQGLRICFEQFRTTLKLARYLQLMGPDVYVGEVIGRGHGPTGQIRQKVEAGMNQ